MRYMRKMGERLESSEEWVHTGGGRAEPDRERSCARSRWRAHRQPADVRVVVQDRQDVLVVEPAQHQI
jgi:hypothetical protein